MNTYRTLYVLPFYDTYSGVYIWQLLADFEHITISYARAGFFFIIFVPTTSGSRLPRVASRILSMI